MGDEDDFDEFAKARARSSLPLGRQSFCVDGTIQASTIVWGNGPEIVFLHGRGQNAYTWDSVALTLATSAMAIDLPGHGQSDWRPDHDYSPLRNAVAVACSD